MAGLTQAGRLLQVKTVLGPDAFLLRRLVVSEALEQPFTIQADLVALEPDIAAARLLGTAVTCTIAPEVGGAPRHFHGIVSAFGSGGDPDLKTYAYRLEAVPLFWFMTRAADCRIFQNEPVQAIIGKMLDERGLGPATFTHMPDGPRKYCTQFNESDFDFVHRLLDESGCTYFFVHSDGGHQFVVTGGADGFRTLSGGPLVRRDDRVGRWSVANWSAHAVVQPGSQKAFDFDSLAPSQLAEATAPTTLALPAAMREKLEVYRWPGGQSVRPDAGDTAALRMRRHEANAESFGGTCEAPELCPGHKVQIKDGPEGAAQSWLLTGVLHSAHDETRIAHDGHSGYSNSFTVIPAGRAWRSPIHRPRPVIAGVQSAIVTGPAGEEIDCDEHGRISVHFLWDHRDTARNQTSSCRVRVAQPFAGAWGGAWFLPRIGDEVLVAFLDGDPDRPVVIGSVYNADGKPPWDLPAWKDRSGIRGRSTKGGARGTANVIGFTDTMGEETLGIHAERDAFIETERDHQFVVGGDLLQEVNGDHQDSPDGKRTTTIKGNETLTITQGNRVTTLNQGNDTLTLDMGNMKVEVSLGNITIKAAVGAITIEALQGVTLKSGPTSKVEVTPTGVAISGMMVTTDAKLLNDNKGLMLTDKGTAMAKFGGAITMIGPG